MATIKNTKTELLEELEESKTPLQKQMLLQKYGMIPPRLTKEEKRLIKREEQGLWTNNSMI